MSLRAEARGKFPSPRLLVFNHQEFLSSTKSKCPSPPHTISPNPLNWIYTWPCDLDHQRPKWMRASTKDADSMSRKLSMRESEWRREEERMMVVRTGHGQTWDGVTRRIRGSSADKRRSREARETSYWPQMRTPEKSLVACLLQFTS
jgi:hypothetical protein